jgi:hypothetical protein
MFTLPIFRGAALRCDGDDEKRGLTADFGNNEGDRPGLLGLNDPQQAGRGGLLWRSSSHENAHQNAEFEAGDMDQVARPAPCSNLDVRTESPATELSTRC